MAEIRKDIEELRAYYGQLYWYQRWFFPSKLAAVLDDPDSKPSRICSVFKENVSFWSYPFLWGIWRFSNSNTFSIYKRLREASLDDYWIEFLDYFESKDALEKQQKLDGFSSRHASSVIEILKFMNQEQPLSSQEADAFFEAIVVHPQPDMILTVLKSLKGTKLLCGPFREQNFYNLIAHGTLASRQGGLNDTFEALSKTRLLCNDHKQTNFNAVLKRALTHGGDLDCALTRVPNSLALFQGDDAQKLFQLIAGHKEPERVTLLLTGITDLGIMINDELLNFCQDQLNSFGVKEIIITLNILYDQGLIQGDENQKMNVVWSVLKHEHAYPLDSILSLLQENRLLDQYNFVTAINDQFFKSYSDLLPFLQKISPHIPEQNQTNFNLLTASIERNKPRYHYMAIKSICSALEKHNLFSQQNFEQVLAHETPEILSEAIIFFCRINNGSNLLTGENAQLTLDLLFRHSTSLEYLTRNITPRHLREHWHPYITTILQRADLTPRELAQTLESYVRIHILQLQIGQAPAIHHPIQHNNEQALINGNQSTHTASVHAATDLTAWLLLETHKKDGGGFINLAGLWPVIEHNFLQRKAKIEQEMQKLEFSPTT